MNKTNIKIAFLDLYHQFIFALLFMNFFASLYQQKKISMKRYHMSILLSSFSH